MTTAKRPTQADVARRAGVSRGTVSLVLNDRTDSRIPISAETRARVLQASAELGYTPNPVAQMLVQGSNQLIGVFTYESIFPFEKDDFFFPYLTGIEREASAEAFNVLLFTRNSNPPLIYANGMNALRLADGCILLGASPNREELRRLSEEDYPFVYIGRRDVPEAPISWVANDYKSGSFEATRHLIALQHKAIAMCGYGFDLEPQADKLAGCRQALEDVPDTDLMLIPEDVFQRADACLQTLRDNRITALLCTDHRAFYTVLARFHDQGLRVPEDFSIVCLTSVDHSLPFSQPPTFVQLNRPALGQVAARLLIGRIHGEITEPQQIYMPCELMVGGTSGPARKGG